MVLILDGNSDIGAHVRSNLFYLIRLRQVIRLIKCKEQSLLFDLFKAFESQIGVFSWKRPIFLYACPSNIRTMVLGLYIMWREGLDNQEKCVFPLFLLKKTFFLYLFDILLSTPKMG